MIKNQPSFLKKYSQKRMTVFLAAIIFFLFGFIWIFFIEPNLLLKIKIEIILAGDLKTSNKELKIAHISDIHFRYFGAREKKLIASLKEISPNYIFITGDLLDWTTENLSLTKDFLKELNSVAPGKLYGVYGNHEHRNKKIFQMKTFFKKSGLEILENESVFLEEGFYLIGVDDPHSNRDDLKKALSEIENQYPKILLAHSPGIFEKIEKKNILILAGHTHGGQINIPFLTEFVFPLKYDKKYKKGLFFENGKWLYVSRGIGTTFIPARLFSPPEITIINLKTNDRRI